MLLIYGNDLNIDRDNVLVTKSKKEYIEILSTKPVSSVILNHFICNNDEEEMVKNNILLTLKLAEFAYNKAKVLIVYSNKGKANLAYDMSVGSIDMMVRILAKDMIINSINPNGAIAKYNHRSDIANEITYPDILESASICRVKRASLSEVVNMLVHKDNTLSGLLIVLSNKSDVVRYR